MAELQSVEAALAALVEGVEPVDCECIAGNEAGGRVLGEDVTASLDVPPFDNSGMDGYALYHGDAGGWLTVSQRIAAGSAATPLAPGSCARIFTGGEIPSGADCVVMQEKVERRGNRLWIPGDVPVGDNIRRRGRDVSTGDTLLCAGERLEAAALGHLAGQGITELTVRRRPRVALLSTGDEIVDPGQPLAPGHLYNSNRPMLRRLLERFGGEVVQAVTVPDDPRETLRLLGEAAEVADLVVTTGGVSVGEEDHVKTAVEALGRLDMWRLAIRPGKPLALGRLSRDNRSEARFVGLPGNPVSGFVGAWLFLRPLLGALLACPMLKALPQISARAAFTTTTGPRRHYVRVALEFTDQGITAHAFRDQNSSVLSSCIHADALAVIPADTQVTMNDRIDCLWLKMD